MNKATEAKNVDDALSIPCQPTHGLNYASSASHKKLNSVPSFVEKQPETPQVANGYVTGFRLVDLEILSNIVSLLPCPECHQSTITLMENNQNRHGFASQLKVFCENCGWEEEFFTSGKGSKAFDVNRRFVYAMRSLGKGHSGAKKFCALMNMPKPLGKKAYRETSKTIGQHIKSIAKKSMTDAAAEIRRAKNANEDAVVNCPVSCDGTWQRWGYYSLNGCITVISIDSGKVLDAEPMSRSCKQCQLHSNLVNNSEEYLR